MQRCREGLCRQQVLIKPALVELQDGLGPPCFDPPLQRPQLALRILTWMRLLQVHENGLGSAFRCGFQSPTDRIPDGFEGIGARAPGPNHARLCPPVFPRG